MNSDLCYKKFGEEVVYLTNAASTTLLTHNLAEALVSGKNATPEGTDRICQEVWMSHNVRQDMN